METEIWPNLYLQAHHQEIPIIMVNARLSESSVKHFQQFSGIARAVLQPVTWIGAQSIEDAGRLTRSGSDPEHTITTGNLKFDLEVPSSLLAQGETLRARWGSTRSVLVAGSTHEADENIIFPAFSNLLKNRPDALLILVPRHPERFAKAAQAARATGLRVELFSDGEACSEQAQCFVIDTMGQLMTYYACADAVFVGGSMGEQGGHNALEPAALGKPVLIGPNTVNAKDVVAELIECGAAICVENQQAFQTSAETLFTDNLLRDRMGQAGLKLVENNRGVLNMTLKAIDQQLSESSQLPG